MVSLFLSTILIFAFCTGTAENKPNYSVSHDTCRTIQDAEKLKNKEAVIFGRLQKYTPLKEGKGRGHMFWQWEIVFPGGGAIPVILKNPKDLLYQLTGQSFEFVKYANKEVVIYGTVYYGIIIGDSNPERQSATGYRIDADSIKFSNDVSQKKTLDTCWIHLDIAEHPNMEAIIAGKLIEYMPPHDNSKLGDVKIWDYELQMQDGYTIPLKIMGENFELESFKDKDVYIKAFIKYGIIFGDTNTANMQGYRIDPLEIYANEKGYGNTAIKRKIRIDLTRFNDDGYRVYPNGEKSFTSYEFCIPATEEALKEVQAIDPTAGEMKGSKGHSACSDTEWLVIGSTRQKNFKDVIKKLAELKYIRKITETFWE